MQYKILVSDAMPPYGDDCVITVCGRSHEAAVASAKDAFLKRYSFVDVTGEDIDPAIPDDILGPDPDDVPSGKTVLSEEEFIGTAIRFELDGERMSCFWGKQRVVKAIDGVFGIREIGGYDTKVGSAVGCELRFYLVNGEDGSAYIQEYLVIHYHGGAYTARSANINSSGANFRQIGELIDGGYYAELDEYERIDSTYPELRFDPVDGHAYICRPNGK